MRLAVKRPAVGAAHPARALGAMAAVVAAALAACTSPASPAGHAAGAASTPVPRASSPAPGTAPGTPPVRPPSSPSRPDTPFRLLPARGPGHLAPGSDPRALPGDVLIADEDNRRLLLVDPYGRIRWRFPGPGALRRGQAFGPPDDAFVSPDGRSIVATQELDETISVIDLATGRVTRRYGHPGEPGSGPGYYSHPDDAMLLPDGEILLADIRNCRILLLSSRGISRQIGRTSACGHEPPRQFADPNGAFPLRDGHFLITEIGGDWVDEMSLSGHVSWSAHPPGVSYPSDAAEVSPDRYIVTDYSSPGQVVIFSRTGHLVWRFGPAGGAAELNHPSLALPLPDGNILVNDDYNDRVIVISRQTNRIIWQYGHDGIPGSAPGYLANPDGVDMAPPYSLLMTRLLEADR